ncbi:MAG: hypothetical protein WC629_00910 [Candidatus Paceibacterota bacterium]|jgi:hypothetical protein
MNKKSNIIAVSVLVGVVVISAGWWTVSNSKNAVQENSPVVKEQGIITDNASSSVGTSSGKYVASKNGSKYFPEGCNGSKSIKEGNKIYFNTPEEAQKAGYELAKNCKN